MKDKTTTALLAFFLGWIGGHRYYLGKNGTGIVYTLFCWTGIPAIVAFVEFFVFLLMSDKEFNAKYNSEFTTTASDKSSVAEEIEKLYQIKEKGIIDEKEFQEKKRRLLK